MNKVRYSLLKKNTHLSWWIQHLSFLEWCMRAKLLWSCPSYCSPMDWSPPGSSVQGILQTGILEWVAMPFPRGSFQLRDRTHVSQLLHWQACSLPLAPPGNLRVVQLLISLDIGFVMSLIFFLRKLYLFKYKAVYAEEGWMRNKY